MAKLKFIHLLPVEENVGNCGNQKTKWMRAILNLLAEPAKTHLIRLFPSCRGRPDEKPVDELDAY